MARRWRWTYEDFSDFYELLTMPDGTPARLEGHLRLIVWMIFTRPGDSGLLVMLPKGNGKTALLGALAVYHLLVTPNANCFIGAANKEQAKEMYRFACHFIRAGSDWELEKYAKILGGTLEIRSKRDEGFILIIASDDSKQGGKKQGLNATLFLIDELHAHDNDSLYIDGRSGLFKRQGVMVTITTAGWDQEGTLGLLRTGFLNADQAGGTVQGSMTTDEMGNLVKDVDTGRLTVACIGDNVMLEWACRPDDKPEDFEAVKLANPASWVTVKSIKNAYEDPGLRLSIYRRYRMNHWTLAFESWLPEGAWEALLGPAVPTVEHRLWNGASRDELDAYVASLYPRDSQVTAAIDMARYRDCAAVTMVGPSKGGLLLPRTVVWRSGGPDNPIPYEPVYRVARSLCNIYAVQALGLDQKYLDEMYATLEDEGLPVESYPQSNERLCPADANLRKAILTDKTLEHDGDPILAAHVNAAVAREITQSGSDAFKLEKSKGNGPPIDAARALSMAYDLAGDMPGDFWVAIR